MNWPDVWGEGQLLAFSGVDGPTDYDRPLVLHTDATPGELIVRLPVECRLRLESNGAIKFQRILGDAIVGTTSDGQPYRLAFVDAYTLLGELPTGWRWVGPEGPVTTPILLGRDEQRQLDILAFSRDGRWALHVTSIGTEISEEKWSSILAHDLDSLIEMRSEYVRRHVHDLGVQEESQRLLAKAISVMKVNTNTADGRIRRRWITPDRWPHRCMALWDSAFHALGVSRYDVDLARESLLAMIEQTNDNGFLPHLIAPDRESDHTQPPILAWAVQSLHRRNPDADWVAACLPSIARHLEWIRENRDRNGNGIPEWLVQDKPNCRCGESGLDNTPRFDRIDGADSVDLASYLINDYACLADLAKELGDQVLADQAQATHNQLVTAFGNHLWCEADGFYYDRTYDGQWVRIKTIAGFMPLLAGLADDQQARLLAGHLDNPATFGAPCAVPTVALDEGTFCKDLWRGPTWLNTSYLIWNGLRRYGLQEQADRLKQSNLKMLQRYYSRTGCLYEFYDSLGLTPSSALDRKQRLSTGKGFAPISDYGWTAAITICFMMEGQHENISNWHP